MEELGTLIAELFGFVVIVFVLYRYVWPVVTRMTRERQDAVQKQVDDSEAAAGRRQEAEQRLDAAVERARTEAAKIRDDARADAVRIREELREQAGREIERIRQRGEEQLGAQRDQTVRRLRSEIAGLAVQLAEQLVRESLSDDDRRRASVDRFLDELDQMTERTTTAEAGARESASVDGGSS